MGIHTHIIKEKELILYTLYTFLYSTYMYVYSIGNYKDEILQIIKTVGIEKSSCGGENTSSILDLSI